ncbi:MAG: protein kinase [Chloroflexota bacterium]|nr:protein kinase [Chloroflexota bacterium]
MDAIKDRYRLVRRVGEGGAGVVYQAADTLLGRTVAVKALRDRFAKNLLRREGRSLARLNHPNVVSVYDLVEDRGRSYLILEYVDGCHLDQWLAEHGPLRPEQALETFHCVARAVRQAHQLGILHCDIKPTNVLVSVSGEVKLTDFTLAHLLAADSFRGPAGSSAGYAAPEQMADLAIDQRTDVYALGALLRRLAGSLDQSSESSRQIQTTIARATAPRPEDRYATVEAMLASLPDGNGEVTRLASRSTVSDLTRVDPITRPETQRARVRWLALPTGGLAAATVLAGVAAFSHFTAQASPVRVTLPDLVTSQRQSAQIIVHSLALRDRVHQAYSPTVPSGTVMRQRPVPGPVLKGSTIDLVVSEGPRPVAMPDLSSMAQTTATGALRRLGLKVVIQTADSISHDSGTILSQSPAARTRLLPGATVTFTVSTKPWYWPF